MGEITDVRDGTHDSPKYVQEGHPFITSKNVSNGFINYDDVQYVTDADYEEINKRSKVDVHDILMGMIGTIGNLALIRKEPDFAIKNVALIKYTGDVDYQYLYQALQAGCVTNQLSTGMDGGTQKFVSLKKIRELDIPFPDGWEQRKIGAYFSTIDHLIALHQQKITLLIKLKKAMLEKMFPKKGSVIPEIRFNGFANAWEQRKLGEITKTHSFKQYISESFAQGKYAVIQQGENPIAGYADGNPFENYKDVTLFGDHTLSLFKPQGKFFVASDGIKILSPSLKMSGMFYYYLLEKYKPQSEGYKRHFTIMKKSTALFPIEIDEQVKISKFLKEFDFLITLHQRKLDMLKKLKSACLSEMFI